MAELTEEAGLAAPEFESRSGEELVRFFPIGYAAPTRVDHDLSPLQRELLEILARAGWVSLKQIREGLAAEPPRRTVQDNLQLLRSLGLVEVVGLGPSARWLLKIFPIDVQ